MARDTTHWLLDQDSNDAVAMQADVEQAKARKRWVQAAGVGLAKAKFLSLLHKSKYKHSLGSLTEEIPGKGVSSWKEVKAHRMAMNRDETVAHLNSELPPPIPLQRAMTSYQ